MLTPDEASRTWCPMARIVRRETKDTGGEHFQHMPSELVGGVNRDALTGRSNPADFPYSCRCLADKCAMWRWGTTKGRKEVIKAAGGRYYKDTEFNATIDSDKGYCGLAGIPIIHTT